MLMTASILECSPNEMELPPIPAKASITVTSFEFVHRPDRHSNLYRRSIQSVTASASSGGVMNKRPSASETTSGYLELDCGKNLEANFSPVYRVNNHVGKNLINFKIV